MKPHATMKRTARSRTPTVLQMEALECGAACLAMVMAYYRAHRPLQELRHACGVSRDGSKASNILKAARRYNFTAKGFRCEPGHLAKLAGPLILHWNLNHFVVLEGFTRHHAWINDPAVGHRRVSMEEFHAAFSGIALTIEPDADFEPSGNPPRPWRGLCQRLGQNRFALAAIFSAELLLVIPFLAVPVFAKIFVDEILVQQLHDWFRPMLVGMLITAVFILALSALREGFMIRLRSKLAIFQSSRFFNHLLRLPIRFHSQRFPGDLTKRLEHNDEIADLLAGQVARTVANLLVVVAYFGLMLYYSVPLTMVCLATAVLNVGLIVRFAHQRREISDLLLSRVGRAYSYVSGSIYAIESIKAGGTESEVFSKWAGHYAHVVNSAQDKTVVSSLITIIPAFLASLATITVLILGAHLVIAGQITIGMLVAFQAMTLAFLTPFNQIVQLTSELDTVQSSLNRLDDVLQQSPDPLFTAPSASAPEPVPGPEPRLSGRMEIRDLVFGYNALEPPLLNGFSLLLEPGKRIALVGASGSGKSTISRLVAGLYQPWSGQILFDDQPIQQIPRSVFTHSLAFVDQDTCLFDGTIRENLALWDESIPMEDILQAARDARVHEVLSARQHGYAAEVEEAGRNFSGGQAQRMEIARALAGNPSILLLDEATSALDPLIEKEIDDNLRRRGCSTLIVAHRLSTIRDADEIIVMHNGRIAQRGTHKDMAHQPGPYADLIQTL